MTTALPAIRPPTNDTEERLLDAALTIFAEKGFEATSVREIIEATGVTRPVLYYYCASKEDLFKRLVHWKHESAYQELNQVIVKAQGCAERLRAIVHGSFTFCAADPRVPRMMFQTYFGPVIPGISEFLSELGDQRFRIIRSVIQSGIARGELQRADAGVLALAFCCLLDQHLNILCRMPRPKKQLTPEFADWLVELFLRGAQPT